MSFLKSGKYKTYCRQRRAVRPSGGRIRKSDIATWILMAMAARNLGRTASNAYTNSGLSPRHLMFPTRF